MSPILDLRSRRWQLSGRHGTGERLTLMGAVAERDIRGMPAATQRDCRPSAEAEGPPFLIDDLEITFDTNRSVAEDGYLGSCHEILRKGEAVCE